MAIVVSLDMNISSFSARLISFFSQTIPKFIHSQTTESAVHPMKLSNVILIIAVSLTFLGFNEAAVTRNEHREDDICIPGGGKCKLNGAGAPCCAPFTCLTTKSWPLRGWLRGKCLDIAVSDHKHKHHHGSGHEDGRKRRYGSGPERAIHRRQYSYFDDEPWNGAMETPESESLEGDPSPYIPPASPTLDPQETAEGNFNQSISTASTTPTPDPLLGPNASATPTSDSRVTAEGSHFLNTSMVSATPTPDRQDEVDGIYVGHIASAIQTSDSEEMAEGGPFLNPSMASATPTPEPQAVIEVNPYLSALLASASLNPESQEIGGGAPGRNHPMPTKAPAFDGHKHGHKESGADCTGVVHVHHHHHHYHNRPEGADGAAERVQEIEIIDEEPSDLPADLSDPSESNDGWKH